MSEIQELTNCMRGFTTARGWEKYHSPENLAKSVSIEAGELLRCFQWGPDWPGTPKNTEEEMADVLIYLIMMADVMGIDLNKAAWDKIAKNAKKYPA